MQFYEYVYIFLILTAVLYWTTSTSTMNEVYSDPSKSTNVFNLYNKKDNLVDFACTPSANNCNFYIE